MNKHALLSLRFALLALAALLLALVSEDVERRALEVPEPLPAEER